MIVYQNARIVESDRFNNDSFFTAQVSIFSAKEYPVDFVECPRALDLRFVDSTLTRALPPDLKFYLIGRNVREFKRDMKVVNPDGLQGRKVLCFIDRSRMVIDGITPNYSI